MDSSYAIVFGLVITVFLILHMQMGDMRHSHGPSLTELATNKRSYFVDETAILSAKFQFPPKESMMNYFFLWTVNDPEQDTPFIAQTQYVYEYYTPEEDVDRHEVFQSSDSSGTGVLIIKIHNLRLEDQRNVKLSVYNADKSVKFIEGHITIFVEEQVSPNLAFVTAQDLAPPYPHALVESSAGSFQRPTAVTKSYKVSEDPTSAETKHGTWTDASESLAFTLAPPRWVSRIMHSLKSVGISLSLLLVFILLVMILLLKKFFSEGHKNSLPYQGVKHEQ